MQKEPRSEEREGPPRDSDGIVQRDGRNVELELGPAEP